jgi:hypothetical protein
MQLEENYQIIPPFTANNKYSQEISPLKVNQY